jgi:hypothetical protein
LRIIREFGYNLPDDISQLRITERVRVADLDENHIVPNMGPRKTAPRIDLII